MTSSMMDRDRNAGRFSTAIHSVAVFKNWACQICQSIFLGGNRGWNISSTLSRSASLNGAFHAVVLHLVRVDGQEFQ